MSNKPVEGDASSIDIWINFILIHLRGKLQQSPRLCNSFSTWVYKSRAKFSAIVEFGIQSAVHRCTLLPTHTLQSYVLSNLRNECILHTYVSVCIRAVLSKICWYLLWDVLLLPPSSLTARRLFSGVFSGCHTEKNCYWKIDKFMHKSTFNVWIWVKCNVWILQLVGWGSF